MKNFKCGYRCVCKLKQQSECRLVAGKLLSTDSCVASMQLFTGHAQLLKIIVLIISPQTLTCMMSYIVRLLLFFPRLNCSYPRRSHNLESWCCRLWCGTLPRGTQEWGVHSLKYQLHSQIFYPRISYLLSDELHWFKGWERNTYIVGLEYSHQCLGREKNTYVRVLHPILYLGYFIYYS